MADDREKDGPKYEKDGLKGQMADVMKKVLMTGVGTIFLTEEAVRGIIGDLKLPKELMGGLLENATKTKQEFLQMLAKEAGAVFSRIDLAEELKKLSEGHKIKVQIEFSLERKKKS